MPLTVTFDFTTLSASVPAGAFMKSNRGQKVYVDTRSNGTATALPAGAGISIKLKPQGQRDLDNIVVPATFALASGETTKYLGLVDAFTTATKTLLSIGDAVATNDATAKTCDAVILYRTSSGTAWADAEESATFQIELQSAINLPDDAEPTALPTANAWLTARAVRFDIAQTLSDAARIQALTNQGITFTSSGYLRLVNSAGDVFHIGLNTGEPPA
jgi:hypothetical protein